MNLQKKYKDIIKNLSNLKDVYGVILFGSYAKNKQKNKSDLDICFITNKNNKKLEIEILSSKNEELDLCLFHNLPITIQFEILKTGKTIQINNPNSFKEIKMNTLKKYKDCSWVFSNIYYRRYGVRI
jgi:predicted nucleotidyltransferase